MTTLTFTITDTPPADLTTKSTDIANGPSHLDIVNNMYFNPITTTSGLSFNERKELKYLGHTYSKEWTDLEYYYFQLKYFERKLGGDSATLYSRWEQGALGSNADVNDWLSSYLIYNGASVRT